VNGESDALNRLIEEVAVRHGIALDRDDPVLMVYTINRQLMECSARIQQAALEQYLSSVEQSAERIHEQAACAMDRKMRDAAATMRQALQQETERLFIQHQKESRALMEIHRKWRRLAALNAAVSVLAVVAAGAVLWSAG
jgi:hypothetical protein